MMLKSSATPMTISWEIPSPIFKPMIFNDFWAIPMSMTITMISSSFFFFELLVSRTISYLKV